MQEKGMHPSLPEAQNCPAPPSGEGHMALLQDEDEP